MLRPAIAQLLNKDQSYYSLVVGVAKRARQITEDAEENHIVLVQKPVKTAVEELAAGKYRIVEHEPESADDDGR